MNIHDRVLIHIGYHKTASTYLQRSFFGLHPEIQLLDRREICRLFLDKRSFDFNSQQVLDYIDSFEKTRDKAKWIVISDEELSGNIHTGGGGGYVSKEIADRIAKCLPNATILIVIRNQVDIVDSIYRQYVKCGGTFNLNKYIAGKGGACHRFPQFSYSHLEYDKLINYYQGLFGHNRVLVRIYEEMKQDMMRFLLSLCEDLDIEPVQTLPQKRENPRFSRLTISLSRMTNRFYGDDPINRRVLFHLPYFYQIMRHVYSSLDQIALVQWIDRKYPLIDSELKGQISVRFAASNLRLQQLIDQDLSKWGYPLNL